MKPLGDIKRHYWLAQRMAKATGADLVAAHQSGELPQGEWAQMVQTCRGCDWTEGCEHWLRANETSEVVPEDCANCTRLAELQEITGSERM